MADRVLSVPAVAYVEGGEDAPWMVQVVDPASPFAGLFAWGPSFAAARQTLAAVVWEAVAGGDEGFECAGIDANAVEGIRILATTGKTFPVATLAASGS